MRTTISSLLVCFASLAAPLIATAEDSAEDRAKVAEQTVEKFWNTIKAKDFEGVLEQIAVPFYVNEPESRTMETKADVDKLLKTHLQNQVFPDVLKFQFEENVSYQQVLAESGAKMKPAERKIFDAVLKQDDRILECKLVLGENGKGDVVIMMVGWRDGKPKIIGIRD